MQKEDKAKSKGNLIEDRQRKKVEQSREGKQKASKKETKAERESR